jgi:hypothetical protein
MKRLLALALAAPAIFAQPTPKVADAVIPVVGSTHGQSNSHFKTELQLANSDDVNSRGWLICRPGNLTRRFDLAPFTTLSFADVVAELGGSGLGSLDILLDSGELPTVVARAYDDQPTGTTGVTVPVIAVGDALTINDVRMLIVPRDLTRYRFNIGVRALGGGATLHVQVRNASGATRNLRALEFDDHEFLQQQGETFAGVALQADDSIEVKIAAGSAIVYATTVDNQTNDSSIQVLRR